MSYQVLARKWRPGRFADLVGQEHVVTAISNALDGNRLHHAYLFTGTRGVGKTTIARIFSKSLNCETGVSASPCGKCGNCLDIDQGRFVDLLEIDAASRTKVEDTRELLDNVQYKPTRGQYKVYLIDEVHMLSKHSFNALLKTLEEPPPHVKFLLATTDPQKLPITILSRCLQFNLKALSKEQISAQLTHILQQETIPFEAQALQELAKAAQGSMRDALSLTDQAIAQSNGQISLSIVSDMLGLMDKNQILRLLHAVLKQDKEKTFELVNELAFSAPDYNQVLSDMQSILHQIALTQFVPDACKLETSSAKTIYALAQSVAPEHIQLQYQIALQGRKDLAYAVDGRSGLEMTLLRMLAFTPRQNSASLENINLLAAETEKKNDDGLEKRNADIYPPHVEHVEVKDIPDNAEIEDQASAFIDAYEHVDEASSEIVVSDNTNQNEDQEQLLGDEVNDLITQADNEKRSLLSDPQTSEPEHGESEFDVLAPEEIVNGESANGESAYDESKFDESECGTESVANYELGSSVPEDVSTESNQSQQEANDYFQPTATLSADGESDITMASDTDEAGSESEDYLNSQALLSLHAQLADVEPISPPSIEEQSTEETQPAVNESKDDGTTERTLSSSHDSNMESPEPVSEPEPKPNHEFAQSELVADTPNAFFENPMHAEDSAEESEYSDDTPELPIVSDLPQEIDSDIDIPFMLEGKKVKLASQLDTWSQLIEQSGLSGLPKQVALHSNYTNNNNQVRLVLNPDKVHLLNTSTQDAILEALSNTLQQKISLVIEPGEVKDTPFTLQCAINNMRQNHAEKTIAEDSNVKLLQATFDAEVIVESIKSR